METEIGSDNDDVTSCAKLGKIGNYSVLDE